MVQYEFNCNTIHSTWQWTNAPHLNNIAFSSNIRYFETEQAVHHQHHETKQIRKPNVYTQHSKTKKDMVRFNKMNIINTLTAPHSLPHSLLVHHLPPPPPSRVLYRHTASLPTH